jgi:hypothetical protein
MYRKANAESSNFSQFQHVFEADPARRIPPFRNSPQVA